MIAPCAAAVDMTAYVQVQKRCPFVEEVDYGAAHISWSAEGVTLELHKLAEWLATWREQRISHELFTESVATYLSTQLDSPVTVKTYWRTAGISITVTAR